MKLYVWSQIALLFVLVVYLLALPLMHEDRGHFPKEGDYLWQIYSLIVDYHLIEGSYPNPTSECNLPAEFVSRLAERSKDYGVPAPGSIETVRIDPSRGLVMDEFGKPLTYRALPDGFLLYSDGPNSISEGGLGDDAFIVALRDEQGKPRLQLYVREGIQR